MFCANCFQEITDDGFVRCANSNKAMHEECANYCMECEAPLTDTEALASRHICNTCLDEVKCSVEVVRRSYIEDYKKCPYQFKLQAIDGKEGDSNAYAENGILLHDLFDLATMDKLNEKEITELFDKRFEEEVKTFTPHQEEGGLKEILYKKGIVAIEQFVEYNNNEVVPLATEQKIVYSIGEDLPKIQITCDRINKHEDGLELVDYKTGSVIVGKQLQSELQIPTYILAVKEHYGELPIRFKLLFLSEKKERVYHKLDNNTYMCKVGNREYKIFLDEKIKEVTDIFKQIRKGRFHIPAGELSPWYCKNRCAMYEKYCMGVEDQPWR